jgi:hypothetical protein
VTRDCRIDRNGDASSPVRNQGVGQFRAKVCHLLNPLLVIELFSRDWAEGGNILKIELLGAVLQGKYLYYN